MLGRTLQKKNLYPEKIQTSISLRILNHLIPSYSYLKTVIMHQDICWYLFFYGNIKIFFLYQFPLFLILSLSLSSYQGIPGKDGETGEPGKPGARVSL